MMVRYVMGSQQKVVHLLQTDKLVLFGNLFGYLDLTEGWIQILLKLSVFE